jgi:hypothetical protein
MKNIFRAQTDGDLSVQEFALQIQRDLAHKSSDVLSCACPEDGKSCLHCDRVGNK